MVLVLVVVLVSEVQVVVLLLVALLAAILAGIVTATMAVDRELRKFRAGATMTVLMVRNRTPLWLYFPALQAYVPPNTEQCQLRGVYRPGELDVEVRSPAGIRDYRDHFAALGR